MRLRGVAVVVHGGGPTPVLNASLAGVMWEAHHHPEITALLGARFGANGLVEDEFIDLLGQPSDVVAGITRSSGSVLGTARRRMQAEDYDRIFDVFQRRNVRYLFYTGGNGSMGTALELHGLSLDRGWEMRVIGIPKTIDNDLFGTDHTPGYGSAARFFAHALRDVGEDSRSLPSPITLVEVLGRNVGWLVAATALARHYEDDAPHLIYFPEAGVSADQLAADAEGVVRRLGRCVIAVCEGQTDEQGGWFGAELNTLPGARDPLPGNMGYVLAKLIWSRTGIRARAEKPGLLGRSCSALVSEVDREESFRCGEAAVRAAVSGESGSMVSICRLAGEYRTEMTLVPLEAAAAKERPFPREWMNAQANDVLPAFIEYAEPLVGTVEPYTRLANT